MSNHTNADRFAQLSTRREQLLDAIQQANDEHIRTVKALDEARGTAQQASAEVLASQAEAALQAADDALSVWLDDPEGVEWAKLDEQQQTPASPALNAAALAAAQAFGAGLSELPEPAKPAYTVSVTVHPSLEFLRDVVTAAIEGGIGYWASAEKYKWSSVSPASLDHQLPFQEVVLVPAEDESDFERTTLTPEIIVRGLQLYLTPGTHNRSDGAEIIKAIAENDASYIDSDISDCIVQLGMLGSITFG